MASIKINKGKSDPSASIKVIKGFLSLAFKRTGRQGLRPPQQWITIVPPPKVPPLRFRTPLGPIKPYIVLISSLNPGGCTFRGGSQ